MTVQWNDSEPQGGLTGRRRYRSTEEGLVLQVEYTKYLRAYEHWALFWRDATGSDVPGETVVGLSN
ncbi:hypothetical protein ACVIF9_008014 [Bradyrhizobium sp. USDA 4350]